MPLSSPTNKLYYGDNLDILRRYIHDESIDLVYLDPPFNSNATYNVLFKEHSGNDAAAQIKAFEDTCTWDAGSRASFEEVVELGGAGFRNDAGVSENAWRHKSYGIRCDDGSSITRVASCSEADGESLSSFATLRQVIT